MSKLLFIKNMKKQSIVLIVVLVASLTLGVWGGYMWGRSSNKADQQGIRQGMLGRDARVNTLGNTMSGKVISRSESTLTIEQSSGGSRIVLLSGSTTVSKTTSGTFNDILEGSEIMVVGTVGTDGSIVAKNIQVGALKGSSTSVSPERSLDTIND